MRVSEHGTYPVVIGKIEKSYTVGAFFPKISDRPKWEYVGNTICENSEVCLIYCWAKNPNIWMTGPMETHH